MSFEIATIAATNYWPRIRVLAESAGRFHSNARVHALIIDARTKEDRARLERDEPNVTVYGLDDLDLPTNELLSARYTITELCTAVKARFLKLVIQQAGCEKLCYIDPDITFFHRADVLDERLDAADIILTPHFLSPDDPGSIDQEPAYLMIGTFNLGFIGLRRGENVFRFLDWWDERTMRFSSEEPGAVFTDQQWINLVPTIFPRVEALTHSGLNVSFANIRGRQVQRQNGRFLAKGLPLIFYHYHGFRLGMRPYDYFRGHLDEETADALYRVYEQALISKTPSTNDSSKDAGNQDSRVMSDGQPFPRILVLASHRMTADGIDAWPADGTRDALDDVGRWLVSDPAATPYSRTLAYLEHRRQRLPNYDQLIQTYRTSRWTRWKIDTWFFLFGPRALRFPAAWLPCSALMARLRRLAGSVWRGLRGQRTWRPESTAAELKAAKATEAKPPC